jgi:hypothetical protein
MSYSLRDVVTDGRLTAPRWFHHAFKLGLQHPAPAAALCLLGVRPIVAAYLAGPIAWFIFALREHFWPTDRQPLTMVQHVTDWATDASLSCLPLVIVLSVADRELAALVGVTVLATYVVCHRGARP